MRKGNKANACINGEWAKHVRRWGKKKTSSIRRRINKENIRKAINEYKELN